jgi:diguanylate cyclase (GGDEF)-like protein
MDNGTEHARGPGGRVLFVDDSRLMRFAAQRFMKQEFDLRTAEHGGTAWDAIRTDPEIAAVITDLNMPEVDGVELIHRIRNAPEARIRGLPILVVTGVEERAGRRRALEAGANDLVPKPFSGSDLIEPTREYLRRRASVHRADEPATRPARHPNIEPTRDALVNRLDQIGSFHDRHALEFAIVHVRVDNYQEIGERFGGNWSESVMRHVERVLAREVRTEDTIGRSAEDCFSIVLMATPAMGAKRLRDRLRTHLARNPARYPGRTLTPALSFAIQVPDFHSEGNAESVLRAGLARLSEPANVTRLADRITA